MNAPLKQSTWDELDERTQRELDRQYLEDLPRWHEPEVTAEGIAAYLAFRHERPGAQITTYEEGQIRRMLHRSAVKVDRPDPVELEEHRGWLERFGANVLHLTNDGTYVAVMATLSFLFVVGLLILVNLL